MRCDRCGESMDPAAAVGGFTTHPGCDLPKPSGRKRGSWIIAGSDVNDVYPCMCWGSRDCGLRCPCSGRKDIEKMPAVCCARRKAETKQRTEARA